MKKANSSEKKGGQPEIHTLFSREIRPIKNWNEWIERWQLAGTIEEMISLLHVGFDVPIKPGWCTEFYSQRGAASEANKRILFYFSIADGWNRSSYFERADDSKEKYQYGIDIREQKKTVSELRQEVAMKAFDMLCQKFFKTIPPFEYTVDCCYKWREIMSSTILGAITSFFRSQPETGGGFEIRNWRGYSNLSHHEKMLVDFFLGLSNYLFDWEEAEIPAHWDKPAQERVAKENGLLRPIVNEGRVWMIDLLSKLRKIPTLEPKSLSLPEPCVERLKQIAMSSKFESHPSLQALGFNETRQVTTLDEACFLGSPEAWFLKRRELILKEDARLTALKKVAEEIQAANKKAKELQAA